MDTTGLLILLPLATFALVIVFALRSKKKTENARDSRKHAKSTLAADGPNSQ